MNVIKLCRKENIANHEDSSVFHLSSLLYLPLFFFFLDLLLNLPLVFTTVFFFLDVPLVKVPSDLRQPV